MQATALVFDVLMAQGRHAVLMRQVYNKTRSYLEWLAARVGGSLTIVDDGDWDGLEGAIGPQTAFVFAETFTNPLVRAQDIARLVAWRGRGTRAGAGPASRHRLDHCHALGVSGSAARSGRGRRAGQRHEGARGTDRDLWGYIATNDVSLANSVMDLVAMRGGILDWRRAAAILGGWDGAEPAHARRSATAARVAAFLAAHPTRGRGVPSLARHPRRCADHPRAVRAAWLVAVLPRHRRRRSGRTRHLADVLATTIVVRYALSFDGLATKVNHHQTVSEYFTAPAQLRATASTA